LPLFELSELKTPFFPPQLEAVTQLDAVGAFYKNNELD